MDPIRRIKLDDLNKTYIEYVDNPIRQYVKNLSYP